MSNDDKCVNSSGDFDMNYGKNAASDILCQNYDQCEYDCMLAKLPCIFFWPIFNFLDSLRFRTFES